MSTLVLTFPNIRTNAKLQESCLLSSHSYHTGLSSGTGTFNRYSSQRAEFLLGLRPGQDAVASPFAALGLYGRRTGVIVAGGHTVPSDGPLWPGLEMIAFQVRDQVAVIPKVQLWDGSHVHFLQAIPLHESELLSHRRTRTHVVTTTGQRDRSERP